MIYLDNNSTTRIDTKVLEKMLPFLIEDYGNASSTQHKMGRFVHQAIEESRQTISKHLKVDSKEIFFTSGSTESISTVIKGVFERYQSIGKHIITCATEHKAVLTNCENLEKKGASITYLPVNKNGQINIEDLKSAFRNDTILVCIMSANNETGSLQPIKEIASICEGKDVLYFCDATQSVGKQGLDLSAIPIDILCFSAHKFHGPKGIGALYIRRKSKPTQIAPLILGGKQENGFRGGTYNSANIIGMGKAIELISESVQEKVRVLRDYFENRITDSIEDCKILAVHSNRLGNTSNILFKHVASTELMIQLPDIALSAGAACMTGLREPSHVLKAMELSDEESLSCIRFSFSKYNTLEEIDIVVGLLKKSINQIREKSPIWQMYKAGILD